MQKKLHASLTPSIYVGEFGLFSETRAPFGPWGRCEVVVAILAIQPVQ
jgi:hypothetical protein